MLVAVYGKGGLIIPENKAIAAQMLVPSAPVVPEVGEIAVKWGPVEGEYYVGMVVTAETGRCDLLRSEAAADLMPSLKYANAHSAIFHQVHGEE